MAKTGRGTARLNGKARKQVNALPEGKEKTEGSSARNRWAAGAESLDVVGFEFAQMCGMLDCHLAHESVRALLYDYLGEQHPTMQRLKSGLEAPARLHGGASVDGHSRDLTAACYTQLLFNLAEYVNAVIQSFHPDLSQNRSFFSAELIERCSRSLGLGAPENPIPQDPWFAFHASFATANEVLGQIDYLWHAADQECSRSGEVEARKWGSAIYRVLANLYSALAWTTYDATAARAGFSSSKIDRVEDTSNVASDSIPSRNGDIIVRAKEADIDNDPAFRRFASKMASRQAPALLKYLLVHGPTEISKLSQKIPDAFANCGAVTPGAAKKAASRLCDAAISAKPCEFTIEINGNWITAERTGQHRDK